MNSAPPTQTTLDVPDSLLVEVLEAVADHAGVSPIDLPPLHDVVDPEVLGALFAPTVSGASRSGQVQFAYCDRLVTVTVDEERTTLVEPLPDGFPSDR